MLAAFELLMGTELPGLPLCVLRWSCYFQLVIQVLLFGDMTLADVNKASQFQELAEPQRSGTLEKTVSLKWACRVSSNQARMTQFECQDLLKLICNHT